MWSSYRAKHDPGRTSNCNSAIKQHAKATNYKNHHTDTEILEHRVTNNQGRLFLESWHFTTDNNKVNELRVFQHAYTPLKIKTPFHMM